MSRTPENENIIRGENQTQAAEAQQSYQDTQKLLAQYGQNIGTLERGGEVGADPYQTPAYLGNENKLTSYATEGENAAAKQSLEMENRRSGGQNTGATQADIAKLALGKMRFGNQQLAQQRAQDYQKNIGFQQYLAGAPLSAAGTEAGLFGTSTSGESSTAGDLSQYALAQQKQWYAELQQLIQAGKAAVGTAAGGGSGADAISNAGDS